MLRRSLCQFQALAASKRRLTSISSPNEIGTILPFVSGVCKIRGNSRLLELCTVQYKDDAEIDASVLADDPNARVRDHSWLRLKYPFGSQPDLRDGYRLFNTSHLRFGRFLEDSFKFFLIVSIDFF
jgi:hypothetical protein